ncbi:hypothetical protein C8R42DRAFT_680425 [Lentinula raphanica]|nr:hypothetical protein C8R42DRAFT_680425 [Lentinula raphanica]
MYLFRIIFTRCSLVVNGLLISMIATAIALPVELAPTEQRKGLQKIAPKGSKEGSSGDHLGFSAAEDEIRDYEFAAVLLGKRTSLHPITADWVMTIIPSFYLTGSNHKSYGYRTIRDPNSSGWTRQIPWRSKMTVTGARIRVSPSRTRYTIAKLRMSPRIKSLLTQAMGVAVNENHTDKLPNIPSGYQYALLLRKQLNEPEFLHTVEIVSFDISETSEYGKVFTDMIKNKRMGGRKVLNKGTDPWEWELYEQIEHYGPVNILEKSLDSQNRYLLEGSWNKLHGTGLPTTSSQNTPLPATSPQNLLPPATSSQNSPLPGTSPQNSPHPATSSQHSTLPDIWTPGHQRLVDEIFESDPEFWSKELDRPSHPSGHR